MRVVVDQRLNRPQLRRRDTRGLGGLGSIRRERVQLAQRTGFRLGLVVSSCVVVVVDVVIVRQLRARAAAAAGGPRECLDAPLARAAQAPRTRAIVLCGAQAARAVQRLAQPHRAARTARAARAIAPGQPRGDGAE